MSSKEEKARKCMRIREFATAAMAQCDLNWGGDYRQNAKVCFRQAEVMEEEYQKMCKEILDEN